MGLWFSLVIVRLLILRCVGDLVVICRFGLGDWRECCLVGPVGGLW